MSESTVAPPNKENAHATTPTTSARINDNNDCNNTLRYDTPQPPPPPSSPQQQPTSSKKNNQQFIVVTEGQLRWAQFHRKSRASAVKQKVEGLWQTPALVSEVDGAITDDGNSSEESSNAISGGETDDDKMRDKNGTSDRNDSTTTTATKAKAATSKIPVSRGRRALLRVSKRAFQKRREEIHAHGFRCCEESDGGDSASDNDINTHPRRRRTRRRRRRRRQRNTDDERLRRFEHAFRAMMMSIAAASEPQLPDIATPTKKWTRPANMPAFISIDGRHYQDLKWGISTAAMKNRQLLTTTNFAAMPVDRRASWLVHIPTKTSNHHHGPYLSHVDEQGMTPVNANGAGSHDNANTALGSEKFHDLLDDLQQKASRSQQQKAQRQLQQRQRRARQELQADSRTANRDRPRRKAPRPEITPRAGNSERLEEEKKAFDNGDNVHDQDESDNDDSNQFDDDEERDLEDDDDEEGDMVLDPESLKSIAAQYLTEFMATADEEHIIAVLGEQYKEDVETLVETASEMDGPVVDSKDIVRRYMQGMMPHVEEKGELDEKGRPGTHDQLASFAGIAARYLAEVARSKAAAKANINPEEGRPKEYLILQDLQRYLDCLEWDGANGACDYSSPTSPEEMMHQKTFEAVTARYLVEEGIFRCNEESIISELNSHHGKSFLKLVTRYLAQVKISSVKGRTPASSRKVQGLSTDSNRFLRDSTQWKEDNKENSAQDERFFVDIASRYIFEMRCGKDGREDLIDSETVKAALQSAEGQGFSRLVTAYLDAMKDSISEATDKIGEISVGKPPVQNSKVESRVLGAEAILDECLELLFYDFGATAAGGRDEISEDELANLRIFEAITARILSKSDAAVEEDDIFVELGKEKRQVFSRIVTRYVAGFLDSESDGPKIDRVEDNSQERKSRGIVSRYLDNVRNEESRPVPIFTGEEKLHQQTFEVIVADYLAAVRPGLSQDIVAMELRKQDRQGFSRFAASYLAALNDVVIGQQGTDSPENIESNGRSGASKTGLVAKYLDSLPLLSAHSTRTPAGSGKAAQGIQNYDETRTKDIQGRLSLENKAVVSNNKWTPWDGQKISYRRDSEGVAARYLSRVVGEDDEDDIFAELRKQDSPSYLEGVDFFNEKDTSENMQSFDLDLPSVAGQERALGLIVDFLAKIRPDCRKSDLDASFLNLDMADRKQIVSTITTHLSAATKSRAFASRYQAATRRISQGDGAGNDALDSIVVQQTAKLLVDISGISNQRTIAMALGCLGIVESEDFAGVLTSFIEGSCSHTTDSDRNSASNISGGTGLETMNAYNNFKQRMSADHSKQDKHSAAKDPPASVPSNSSAFTENPSGSVLDVLEGKAELSHVGSEQRRSMESDCARRVVHAMNVNPESPVEAVIDLSNLPLTCETPINVTTDSTHHSVNESDVVQDDHHQSAGSPFSKTTFESPLRYFEHPRIAEERVSGNSGKSYSLNDDSRADCGMHSPNCSHASTSEFSPERVKEFHQRVREKSALIGDAETEQTIIDTDDTTSNASNPEMDPKKLAGLMLSPTILTKRHRQAINAIETKKWDQVSYLLHANPWLAEMPDINTNQYLLHKLAYHGAGYPAAPDQLGVDLVKLFPVSVHKFDRDGNLPLHMAASSGNLNMIKLLGEKFSSGASVRNEEGMLPLHLAILSNASHEGNSALVCDVIRTLLAFFPGALAIADNEGNLPIHTAGNVSVGDVGVTVVTALLDEAELQMRFPTGVRFRNKTKKSANRENSSDVTANPDFADDFDEEVPLSIVVNDSGDTALATAIRRLAGQEIIEALASGPGGRHAVLQKDSDMNNALHLLLGDKYSNPPAAISILKEVPEAALERNSLGMLPIEVACFSLASKEVVLALVLVDLPVDIHARPGIVHKEGRGHSWWFLASQCNDQYVEVVAEIISMCSYQQVHELCFMPCGPDATVVSTASPQCGEFLRVSLLFVGRFELLGNNDAQSYPSIGLKAFDALDYGKEDDALDVGRPTLLRCYSSEEMYAKQIASIRKIALDFNYVEYVSCFVVGARDSYDSGGAPQYCVAIEQPNLTLDRIVAGMLKNDLCSMNGDLRKKYVGKSFIVLQEVARALQKLHSCGLVHANLSPSHCGKFGELWKLLGALQLHKSGETLDGTKFGASAPPEAVEPQATENGVALERRVVFRTTVVATPSLDIWGFGKLAYDVLVGRPLIPFNVEGNVMQNQEALFKVLHWSALDLVETRRQLREVGVPTGGVDLIAKCLARDPNSRPFSMDEILQSGVWRDQQTHLYVQVPDSREHVAELHEC